MQMKDTQLTFSAIGLDYDEVVSRVYPAQQIMDECHETKNPSTGAMRTFLNNVKENEDCKALFMSGTPSSQSPAELEGIFEVSETTASPEHKQLQHACEDKLKNLVASYKGLLQRESEMDKSLKITALHMEGGRWRRKEG